MIGLYRSPEYQSTYTFGALTQRDLEMIKGNILTEIPDDYINK